MSVRDALPSAVPAAGHGLAPAQFRTFVERAPDGMLVVDAEGIVRFANPAAVRLLAHDGQNLVGACLGVPAILDTSEMAVPAQGGLRQLEVTASAIDWDGQPATLANLRDITKRHRAEQGLTEALAQFRGLVDQAIAGIYILSGGRVAYCNQRFAQIHGAASAAALEGAGEQDLIHAEDRDRVGRHRRLLLDGHSASVAFEYRALRGDGAMIEVGTNDSLSLFQGAPAIVGMMQDISEKRRAEARTRDHIGELRRLLMGSVDMATHLVEMRDPYTAGHSRRVAALAAAMGRELGLDESQQEGLRVAGLLHDIGKITIPADLLSRPARLNPLEMGIVRGHTQAGHDILNDLHFPWPVAQVALQHHERLDGSGYPAGLNGAAIRLEARIMAVADVLEAASSHRPYRPGKGVPAALAELEAGCGTLYDEAAVGACLRLFREKGFRLPE